MAAGDDASSVWHDALTPWLLAAGGLFVVSSTNMLVRVTLNARMTGSLLSFRPLTHG